MQRRRRGSVGGGVRGAVRAAAACVGLGVVLSAVAAGQTTRSARELDRADGSWALSFGGTLAFTKPSADAVMGFSIPTTVTEIVVPGGKPVREGDLIVRGEDGEQTAIYEQTRLRAESDLAVRRVQKQAELAKLEFERMQDAFNNGGVGQLEVDRARLSFEVARIDLETAELNVRLEKERLAQAGALLKRYRISAPFDGFVDEVYRDVGTSLDNAQPVVRVVRVDPLWIDAPVPTERTIELNVREGDAAWVLIDTPGKAVLASGRVIEVGRVADYASRSRRVRVELDNPELLPPGLRCWVRFSEPGGEWAELAAAVEVDGAEPVAKPVTKPVAEESTTEEPVSEAPAASGRPESGPAS